MLRQCGLACLMGLACGVANGLYLLLVLHATSVARGMWRNLVVASWPVHVVWPVLLVVFVVLPPFAERGTDSELLCFVCSYALPWFGALIWYLRTHPNPLQIDWRRRDQHGEQSPVPVPSVTEPSAIGGEIDRSRHVLHYYPVAAGCGVGLALYLLLSRRAFLHYYLGALGCGVGLALYVLLFMRALRLVTGTRRRVLQWLWPSAMLLYGALWVAFSEAGRRLGLVGDYAAELGIPFLLGVPPLGMAIWHVIKYPSPESTEPTGHGA